MTILVTGSSGFIGKRFIERYRSEYGLHTFSILEKDYETIDWEGIDAVLHLAALVHQMDGAPWPAYLKANVEYPVELAKRAKAAGVKHFLFLSSVKVYGEESEAPFTESSPCCPEDDYGRSKLLAEEKLKLLEDEDFTVAALRTPVVYGPGVGGNILRLLRLTDRLPVLPFGCINNRRSMVYVDNLLGMIGSILERKSGGIFLASDWEAVSTTGLIESMADVLGKKKPFCFPGVGGAIRFLKPELYRRLYGNFEVDNRWSREYLNFTPPYSTDEGVAKMVEWYRRGV